MSQADTDQHSVGLGLGEFTFERFAVVNLARVLYILGWLAMLLVGAVLLGAGLYLMFGVGGWGFVFGLICIGAAPIVLFAGVMIIRVLLEAAVLLYRIEHNTRPHSSP